MGKQDLQFWVVVTLNQFNLKQLNDEYVKKEKEQMKKRERLKEKVRKLQDEIKLLEKKVNKTYDKPTIQEVFKPLMEAVKEKIKAQSYEWLGAFGLNSEMCCHFRKERKCIGSLNFVVREGGYYLRNYRKKVHNYPNGSIAKMNGENFEVLEPKKEMNANWLIKNIMWR